MANSTSFQADRNEWVELLGSSPSDKTLDFVGLSRPVWNKILSDKGPPIPVAAFRLARYLRYFQLSDLAGPTWEGFEIRGNMLLFPGLNRPLSVADLKSTWFMLQDLRLLRAQVETLKRDLERAEEAEHHAEKTSLYWRRQCSLEARAGLMLADLIR